MASALCCALHGYDTVVDHVSTLGEAEAAISVGAYSAILLDRRVPDGDGITLIPKLRARGITVPVIVLTARGEIDDRVNGLDAGADDYLAKPFSMDELLARLRAVMRRRPDIESDVLRYGRLSFDSVSREARIDEDRLDLPRRELLVLEVLLQRIGRTVSRATLEESVYGFGDEIQSNALDTHISRLRRKLADADVGLEIHPVRGVGYLLKRSGT